MCAYLILSVLPCGAAEVGAQTVNECTACFRVAASTSCRTTREAYCGCNTAFKQCFDGWNASVQRLPPDSAYGAYAGKTCAEAYKEDQESNCDNLPCDECYLSLATCTQVAMEGAATSVKDTLCGCNEQFKDCYTNAGAKDLRIVSSIAQRDLTCEEWYKEDDKNLSCRHGLEWHWILLLVIGFVLLLSACAQAIRRLVMKRRRARMSMDIATL